MTPGKSLWFLCPRQPLWLIVQLVTANTERLRHQYEPFSPAESVQWQNLAQDFLSPLPACLWWSRQALSPVPAFDLTSYWSLLGKFTLCGTGWVMCKRKKCVKSMQPTNSCLCASAPQYRRQPNSWCRIQRWKCFIYHFPDSKRRTASCFSTSQTNYPTTRGNNYGVGVSSPFVTTCCT